MREGLSSIVRSPIDANGGGGGGGGSSRSIKHTLTCGEIRSSRLSVLAADKHASERRARHHDAVAMGRKDGGVPLKAGRQLGSTPRVASDCSGDCGKDKRRGSVETAAP
jgi:hypothetical protein